MGIVDDIMDGTADWEQIFVHNIEQMDKMIERERNNKHDRNTCKRKYCKHGGKRAIQQMVDHRDKVKRELQVIRAGVTPSDVR